MQPLRKRPLAPTAWGRVVVPTTPPRGAEGLTRYPGLGAHRGAAVIAFVLYTVYQYCNVDRFLYRGTPAYPLLNSFDSAVPWLFVTTAFLLFRPVAGAFVEGEPLAPAASFLVRRALRIVPLYYFTVAVVWFARQPSLPGDWRDLLEHLTFTQVFDDKRIFYTDGPTWAVSVTAWFVLGIAVLIAGLSRLELPLRPRRHRVVILLAVSGVLGGVSIAWRTANYADGNVAVNGSFATWFGPVANLDSFAVGMALAVLVSAFGDRAAPLSVAARRAVRGAAVAVLLLAFATRTSVSWSVVYFAPLCALAFAALVAATVLGPAAPDAARRRLRPLLWLGSVSYGIFLWHEPILLGLSHWHGLVRQTPGAFAADAILVVVTSAVAGELSRRLIQAPTERLIAMTRKTAPRPVRQGR